MSQKKNFLLHRQSNRKTTKRQIKIYKTKLKIEHDGAHTVFITDTNMFSVTHTGGLT